MAARQRDWSGKNADFSTLVATAMSLDASQKAKYDNKPFHLCTTTTPEISVKIGPSDSEKQPVESRPLKIFKK